MFRVFRSSEIFSTEHLYSHFQVYFDIKGLRLFTLKVNECRATKVVWQLFIGQTQASNFLSYLRNNLSWFYFKVAPLRGRWWVLSEHILFLTFDFKKFVTFLTRQNLWNIENYVIVSIFYKVLCVYLEITWFSCHFHVLIIPQ